MATVSFALVSPQQVIGTLKATGSRNPDVLFATKLSLLEPVKPLTNIGVWIPERLRLFREVCEAVRHPHRHLIIHRDLKPSNVLVTPDGATKLRDFGISKRLEEADRSVDVTLTSLRMMTPAYAAPEQIRGGPSDCTPTSMRLA